MSTDYSRALGARLRAIRNQQGLSLQGVEDKSHGRWKAVVVGSYERGDRAVTVQRLSELAVFYGVPVSELLPDPRPSSAVTTNTKIVLNLESLGSLPADEAGPLARYASTIQAQRHDYNGKVLSIRTEDLKSLAIIYDMSPDELTSRLIEWGVLSPGMEGIVGMGGDDLRRRARPELGAPPRPALTDDIVILRMAPRPASGALVVVAPPEASDAGPSGTRVADLTVSAPATRSAVPGCSSTGRRGGAPCRPSR